MSTITAIAPAPSTTVAPSTEWDAFTAVEAVEWIAAGYDSGLATAWTAEGFLPAEATTWADAGWHPQDQAGAWITAFDCPNVAYGWRKAGWTADEAAALDAAGLFTDATEEWLGADADVHLIIRCIKAGVAPVENEHRAGMANSRGRYDDEEF